MNLYRKFRILSGKLFIAIALRESNLYGNLFSGLLANQLILKSGDELSGAKLQILLLRCTAVKLLSVNGSAVVDIYGIPFLGRIIYHGRILIQGLLDGIVHFFLGYILQRCYRNGDAL